MKKENRVSPFAIGIYLALSLALLNSSPAWSAAAAENPWVQSCATFKQSASIDYCVFSQPATVGPDVVYYLGGRGDDARKWIEDGAEMRAYWKKTGTKTPTVIGVTFGSWWLMTEHDRKGGRGHFPIFTEEFMPMIEKKIGGIRGRRLLMGQSMGGYNATQLLLKLPKEFERVVLLCPAIISISPYADNKTTAAYQKRTGANFINVFLMKLFFRMSLQNRAAWTDADSLAEGMERLGPDTPKLHISCGEQDGYGFHEGAEEFAKLAKSLSGSDVTWQSLPGGHCTYDSESVAQFLID